WRFLPAGNEWQRARVRLHKRHAAVVGTARAWRQAWSATAKTAAAKRSPEWRRRTDRETNAGLFGLAVRKSGRPGLPSSLTSSARHLRRGGSMGAVTPEIVLPDEPRITSSYSIRIPSRFVRSASYVLLAA